MTNEWNRVLYTGITGSLTERITQHRTNVVDGFTKKYCVHKLVYYEGYNDVMDAIVREKQIKAGSRRKKEELIQKMNPWWEDLGEKWR